MYYSHIHSSLVLVGFTIHHEPTIVRLHVHIFPVTLGELTIGLDQKITALRSLLVWDCFSACVCSHLTYQILLDPLPHCNYI
jgi:hypothetical protein